jgi:predicted RND superfamily exporter protein
MIGSSRGMKEMGLVTGAGLLAILAVTILFLPAVLVLRERRLERKKRIDTTRQEDISFRFLGSTAETLSKRYRFTLIAAILLTLLFIWSGSMITFDHNYMNMEPEGLTSVILQDTILEKFDLSMDYALILADSVDESRQFARRYKNMSSVALTEDISIYLPDTTEQAQRTPLIFKIRDHIGDKKCATVLETGQITGLIAALDRLEMNVMEMQDMAYLGGQDKVDTKCQELVGDPANPQAVSMFANVKSALTKSSRPPEGLQALQRIMAPYFKETVLQMCSTRPVSLDDLPTSILDRYSNIHRDQFLVTVFPAGNMWQDAEFLKMFVKDLERVTDRATGMPPVFRALIEVIGRDGQKAVFLTLLIVLVLLWIDFRSIRYALMAMIPLSFGFVWMLGLMYLSGMQLTVMNVMGLPMILGIGIDDGVHIVHRWIHEGRGRVNLIFASTGKAILLTSLTTMLAFGSLIFSIWRGFAQLGGALFIGVAACFLTTVIIFAGLIGWRERIK